MMHYSRTIPVGLCLITFLFATGLNALSQNPVQLSEETILKNANDFIKQHKFTVAREYLLSVEKKVETWSPMNQAEYHLLKGVIHFELYQFSESLHFLEEAKQRIEINSPHSTLHGDVFLYIGLVYKEGYYNSLLAREFYELANKIFVQLNDVEKIAATNFQLARSFSFNEIDKREFYNLQAKLFYEKSPEQYSQELAECYNLEAIRLSYKYGFDERAISLYEKAIEISKSKPDKAYKLGKYFDNLGYLLISTNQEKSLYYLRCGLNQNLSIPDNGYWIASSCNNLATYYQEAQQFDSANFYLHRFLKYTIDVYTEDHPQVSNAYNHLANFVKNYDSDSALSLFRKALFLDSASDSISELNLKTNKQAYESEVLIYPYIVVDQSNVLYKKYEASKDVKFLLTAIHNLNVINTIVVRKLSTIDWENSRISYVKSLQTFYQQFIRLLHHVHSINQSDTYALMALDAIETIRYISVLENKRESTILEDDYESITQAPRSLSIRGEFVYYQTLINQINADSNSPSDRAIQKKYVESSEKYYSLINKKYSTRTNPKPASEIIKQKGLTTGSAIIEYFDAGDALYAILLTDKDVFLKKLTSSKNLLSLVREFEHHFENLTEPSLYRDSLISFVEKSHLLYSILLQPFEEKVLNADQLIIIPDGLLHKIPFEALVVTNNHPLSFREVDYLIKHITIKRSLAISQLFSSQQKSFEIQKVLAFASNLLPSANAEVKMISGYFDTEEVKDSLCSLNAFLKHQPDYNFIHLAVHGESDLSNPLKSRLIFNDQNGDTLFAYQLYSLDLSNKFIVLSACKSGVGLSQSGEGIFSISRAFFYSGVNSLLATLWNVGDNQTLKVMSLFYKNLAASEPPDFALHKAKLAYLSESDNFSAHPIFWSGFVIEGSEYPTKFNLLFLRILIPIISLAFILFLIIQKSRKRSKIIS